MQDIRDFHIGSAYYFLENEEGCKLKLSVNYAQNKYGVKIISGGTKISRLKKTG